MSCPGWRWTTQCPALLCLGGRGCTCMPGWLSPPGPFEWSVAQRLSPASPASHLMGQKIIIRFVWFMTHTSSSLWFSKSSTYAKRQTGKKTEKTNFSLKHINMGFKLWACAHKQSHSGVGADLRLIGLLSQTEEDLRVWRWNKSKSGIFVEMSCVLIWNSRGSLVVRNILVNDGENWMSRHEKCTWQVAVRSCFWADTHPADSLFMAMDFNYCW